jgi:Uncharacterised nucleotidyltransferase
MAFSTRPRASPEEQLLILCARTEADAETEARIRETAAKPLDWEYVQRQAEEHSIVPLLERNLREAGAAIRAEDAAKLEALIRENAARCLALSAELMRVMDSLESRGVRAIPYKGPVIAARAYGDVTARQFEDLDVALEQREIETADAAMRTLGYEARFPWLHAPNRGRGIVPGEYSYAHPTRRTFVELHTELTLRHFPVRPDLGAFFQRAVKVNLGGGEVRAFSAEDELVVLCVHGAKDFWQRLIWISDIAELLRACPALDWNLVLRTSERLRARRMLHLGLELASRVLGTKLPGEIFAEVKSDSDAAYLAADVERRLLSRETREPSASERLRFRRRTVEGMFGGWRYAVRLAMAPAEEDWESLRVPRRLGGLYAALRPFRLLRKYGAANRT